MHPNGQCAVVGTTEGWLITSTISQPTKHSENKVAFHAPSYKPVQSVSFIDDNNLLVFYARGSVILFSFDDLPTPLHYMTMGATGVPI